MKIDFSLKWFGIPNEIIVKNWKFIENLPKDNLVRGVRVTDLSHKHDQFRFNS